MLKKETDKIQHGFLSSDCIKVWVTKLQGMYIDCIMNDSTVSANAY